MDDISNLLQAKKLNEPSQINALKQYAQEKHGVSISVKSAPKYYLMTVPGASLAGKLRIETEDIMKQCNLDKRLVIHIGH